MRCRSECALSIDISYLYRYTDLGRRWNVISTQTVTLCFLSTDHLLLLQCTMCMCRPTCGHSDSLKCRNSLYKRRIKQNQLMSSKRWDSRPQSICRCSINPKAGQRCIPARTYYFEMLGSAKSVQYSYAGAFPKVTIRSTRNKIPFSGHMMLLWHIKYSKHIYLFILFLGRSHCQGRTAWLCTAVELVWTRPNKKGVKECIVSQTAAIKVAATPVYNSSQLCSERTPTDFQAEIFIVLHFGWG